MSADPRGRSCLRTAGSEGQTERIAAAWPRPWRRRGQVDVVDCEAPPGLRLGAYDGALVGGSVRGGRTGARCAASSARRRRARRYLPETDMDHDWEYTDWDQVDAFAHGLGGTSRGMRAPRRTARATGRRGADEVLDQRGVVRELAQAEEVATRARAPPPRDARPRRGRRGSRPSAAAKASGSRGSWRRSPSRPSSIWSTIPPTALATTGRAFHIASVTVRPKPSRRLFWTTTARGAAARSRSRRSRRRRPWGGPRSARAGAARAQGAPGRRHLREHGRAVRVVGDAGDGRSREHELGVSPVAGLKAANPSSTPMGSLRRSQRETCTTSGTPARGRARPHDVGAAVDAPRRAVLAQEGGCSRPAGPSTSPVRRGSRARRLVEVLVLRRRRGRSRGGSPARAPGRSTRGRTGRARTRRVGVAQVGGQEVPAAPHVGIAEVLGADVAAPGDQGAGARSAGASPAVWGSWSSTTSPGRTSARSSGRSPRARPRRSRARPRRAARRRRDHRAGGCAGAW